MFTLSASLPDGVVVPVGDVAPLSVRWATVSGTAVPGAHYQGASGMASIPADGRLATISVPLADNSVAESTESFSLRLTNAVGATLVDTSAAATITDDDGRRRFRRLCRRAMTRFCGVR